MSKYYFLVTATSRSTHPVSKLHWKLISFISPSFMNSITKLNSFGTSPTVDAILDLMSFNY